MSDEVKILKNVGGVDGKGQTDDNDDKNPKIEDKSYSVETVINIIKNGGVEILVDQFDEVYASFNGMNKMLKTDSSDFKNWVRLEAYRKIGKAFCKDTIENAAGILEAKAKEKNQRAELYIRAAKDKEGNYWYDLSKEAAVKINKDSWIIVQNPPKIFKKFKTQAAQVTPIGGKKLSELIGFFNLSSEDDKILMQIYLVTSYIFGFPHPILILFGQHGSGKSTACKYLKSLTDPSVVGIMGPIRNSNDFIQAVSHNWTVYFDNLSRMNADLSDALCRVSTGEGFLKRKLYSNDEDFVYDFQHIVGLNGINNLASKSDLLDRSLLIELTRISEKERSTDEKVKKAFNLIKPYIIGACFDAVAKAINILPNVKIEYVPRMADFAYWGYAVAEALGIGGVKFLQAYENNILRQNREAIKANPVAKAILIFMAKQVNDKVEETPDCLFDELIKNAYKAETDYTKDQSWPTNVNWFGRRLNEAIPNLEKAGIRITKSKGDERMIIIEKINTDIKSNSPLNDDIDVSEIPMDDGLTPAERERKQAYGFNGNDIKNGDDFDVSKIMF